MKRASSKKPPRSASRANPDGVTALFTRNTRIGLLLWIFASAAVADAELVIPVSFHSVEGLVLEKRGIAMTAWVRHADIRDTLLPAINRIWRPAGIRFELRAIHSTMARNPADRVEIIDYIVGPHRDGDGRSDPERIRRLQRLVDFSRDRPGDIAVYLLPFLGENSHGSASPRQRRVFVGQWSDKASHGMAPPARFRLVEPGPFRTGSMSRTIAHELGHVLGLPHSDRNTRAWFGRLMGTGKPGYRLTGDEVETARRVASELLAGWASTKRSNNSGDSLKSRTVSSRDASSITGSE